MEEVESTSPPVKDIKKNQNTEEKKTCWHKANTRKKKQKREQESSTDEGVYSLHDSSEYCNSDEEISIV